MIQIIQNFDNCIMSGDKIFVVLALFAIFSTVSARTGYGPGNQEWGYVDIREGAHMFYWLYKTTANVSHYTERPLVLWLQGGPGDSSTGIGNFRELGPLDIDGNSRSLNWVKDVNVLFIDNPVGSGFSYVDNKKYLATNNEAIALDLLKFMKSFYTKHPEFVNVPLHIFGESYGGKMAADFALGLYYAIQRNEIKCNLKSVTMANPIISPIDTFSAWAPTLFATGLVDRDGYNNVQLSVDDMLAYMQKGDWYKAVKESIKMGGIIRNETNGVDFYNILKSKKDDEPAKKKLQTLMRGPVSSALGIPSGVVWDSQNFITISALAMDLFKPVNQTVQDLLSNTDLTVNVISGQLDIICSTIGTVNWINKMQWKHRDEYVNAPRMDINVNGTLEGYEKSGGKFSLFWVLRAGHMTAADNPAALNYILRKITKFTDENLDFSKF